jgi:hypothetical protein
VEHDETSRRDLLLASLLTAAFRKREQAPSTLSRRKSRSPISSNGRPARAIPKKSADRCNLTGDINAPGLYYTLIRWRPGYMSAPHTHTTDRFCMVLSGIYWCNGGADFDPASCVPVSAGCFVRRVAGTPHYDGVIPSHP